MKKNNLFFGLLFVLVSLISNAQQEAQYTQYMYNTMIINPGYTGSRGCPSVFGLHRAQWVGLEGAPKTSTLSFHMPFEGKNVGLGGSILHESIGPQAQNNIVLDFSYTLNFETSKLAFGLNATAGFWNFDKQKLRLYDGNDPSFLNMEDRAFYPNVGVGAYWYSDKYYLGLSVPNMLKTKVFVKDDATISSVNSTQHFYIIGGYVFDLSDSVKFKPAALTKIAQGSPLQLDVSANFMFNDKFVAGAAYRMSAAVSLMAGFQINKNMYIGYAYDFETTPLKKYNSGSHEVFLRYEFLKDLQKVISPRFF